MLKKSLILFAIFLLAVVLCSGCSRITSGTIVSKKFVAKHTIHQPSVKVGDITIPAQTTHVPDKWYITFESESEDGKMRTRTVQVTEGFYDKYNRGDLFSMDWK